MAVNGVNTANDGKNVYIVEKESLEIIKRIRIPDSYNNTELYTFSGKLIVVANKYGNVNNRWYGWYQNNIKTVVAIYDISNPKLPKLDRYTQFDGTLSQSRVIGGKLYIIATNPLTLPQIYAQEKDISEKFTETFSVRNTIPRIIDTYKKTLETKYTRENRPAIQCSEMEYILPDKATADKYSFNPAFSLIAMIDVLNTNTPIASKMIFGDVGEIHMSTKSLYLVSNIWSESTNNRCPMNARCFAPSFGQSTTLVHKFTLNNTPASYVYTTLLNGNLLNQYSMDEEVNTGYFRILTQVYGNWENGQNNNSTELSILGTDGKILGNLKNI